MAKKKRKKKSKSDSKGLLGRLFDKDDPLLAFDVSSEATREIVAIVLGVLGVFFLLSLFGMAGSFGGMTATLLRHLFGFVAFIVPILLLVIAWEFFKPGKKAKDPVRITGVIGGILFMLAFPTLLHIFYGRAPIAAVEAGRGGGLIGYWLSSSLVQATGGAVAFLIALAFTAISLILIFDLSLRHLFGLAERAEDDPTDAGVRINQPGKAPVFESIRRIGLGRRGQVPARTLNADPTTAAAPIAPVPTAPGGFQLPQTEILELSDTVAESGDIAKNVEKIQKTLADFSVAVTMGEVNVGPTVTQYTCKPTQGVKLNQITARSNDLALSLAAKSIRIEAPIPGKAAVGIEVPNKVRAKVTIREILESGEFTKGKKSLLSLALGRDVAGVPVITDIESMPHLLVAGATGSGKSVCINTMLLSLLYQNSPETLRLILVDPKRVELTMYNHIPHLLTPVITEPDKTISALKWGVAEMDRRYRLFSEVGRRNIQAFNEGVPAGQAKMPYLVLVIDELADLMSVAARDVEGMIVRLAQMARATGIHLIVATQRPSVDVITGLIKANIPTRIAFATASQADSRTILDMGGAEKLLGNGDMLYQSAEFGKPKRIQGAFASDKDINGVIAFVKGQGMAQYNDSIVATTATTGMVGGGSGGGEGGGEDDMYNDAVAIVQEAGKASASLLQRRLRIGYARAARLLDILEDNGVIGSADGARPREVYGGGAGRGGGGDDSSGGIQAYPE